MLLHQLITQLCKIKSYPQLGGERETIETTDMEDNAQTFVPGVQSVSAMQFTCNYDKAKYASIKETANTDQIMNLILAQMEKTESSLGKGSMTFL